MQSQKKPVELNIIKKPNINNQIRAKELRVVGKDGENLGVLKTEEALAKAKEAGLDLIEIAPTAVPPVAKIIDYGKYMYQQEKKARETGKKSQSTETKSVQVSLGISQRDLEMKTKRASEFLKEGNRVKIDLILRGRAKYLDKDFINERMERVLHFITEKYRIADGPKKAPRGLTITIEKTK